MQTDATLRGSAVKRKLEDFKLLNRTDRALFIRTLDATRRVSKTVWLPANACEFRNGGRELWVSVKLADDNNLSYQL